MYFMHFIYHFLDAKISGWEKYTGYFFKEILLILDFIRKKLKEISLYRIIITVQKVINIKKINYSYSSYLSGIVKQVIEYSPF